MDNLPLIREHILWDGKRDLNIVFHNVHVIAEFEEAVYLYKCVWVTKSPSFPKWMCKDTLKCLLNLTTTTPHTVVKTTVISHLDYCNKLSLFNLILLLPLCRPPRQQDYLQHSSSCNVALHNLTLLGKTLQVSDRSCRTMIIKKRRW